MKTCKNNGCGKKYSDGENSDNSCIHHPKGPIFHEGLKGWGCCSKRVSNFDEFMSIPGCSTGSHAESNPIPERESIPDKVSKSTETVSKNIPKADQFIPSQPAKLDTFRETDLNDPIDAIIDKGSKCKRNGCNHVHDGTTSDCFFHPGHTIFHEGSKGWSCCARRVLEFDEFLKISGCTRGLHRYLDPERPQTVTCRHDWYQTQNTVTINLYAKNVKEAKVNFKSDQINCSLVFQNNTIFDFSKKLCQPILAEESEYTVRSTKVEIVLMKANGLCWASIEPQDEVRSFTTFGTSGGGTVGAKVAFKSDACI